MNYLLSNWKESIALEFNPELFLYIKLNWDISDKSVFESVLKLAKKQSPLDLVSVIQKSHSESLSHSDSHGVEVSNFLKIKLGHPNWPFNLEQ